jgi:GT2 family glycosyltransferase
VTGVSVAIVTWNAAAFIDATLAGVAAQDLRPEQLVIVDNGSTDETVDKISSWRSILPIELIRSEINLGMSRGKRLALERVATSHIAFLDHDDYWFPNYLSSAMQLAAPNTMVSPAALVWSEQTGQMRRYTAEQASHRPATKTIVRFEQLLFGNPVFAGCLAPTAALQSCGAFVSEGEDLYCCDYDAWSRFVLTGGQITQAKHPTVLYRRRAGSASTSIERLIRDEIRMLVQLRMEFPNAVPNNQWENALFLREQHLSLVTGQTAPVRACVESVRRGVLATMMPMAMRSVRESRRRKNEPKRPT